MMSQSWTSSLIMQSMELSCIDVPMLIMLTAPCSISFMVSSSQRPCQDTSSTPTVLIPAPTSWLAHIPCPTNPLDGPFMPSIIWTSQAFSLVHVSMHLVVLVPLAWLPLLRHPFLLSQRGPPYLPSWTSVTCQCPVIHSHEPCSISMLPLSIALPANQLMHSHLPALCAGANTNLITVVS